MDGLTEKLRQYYQGAITLADLESTIDLEAIAADSTSDVLNVLDKEFAGGRLPTQLYHALRARVAQSSGDAAQQVAPAELDSTPKPALAELDPTQQPEPAELDPTFQPEVSHLEPTVQVEPEATMTASIPNIAPITKTEVISPPPVASPTPLDFELPSQSSRPTGSNWENPDHWTDKQQGPIGPGSVIANRYVIDSQLGRGGMGIVFKARDRMKEEAQDTNPFIAIKILSGDFREHPQSLMALQREATKAQKLAHPNIVTVYDFSRDGTTVYMTMELMRGDSLADKIRAMRHGGLNPDEARPIILDMAIGLAYAHKRDIVHSDFKPGNVFLLRDGRVKLLDFGIARAAQHAEDAARENAIFDAGDLGAMTPTYASLEMIEGEPPHPADDVYALAVSAYALLTGEHPFNRLTAKEAFEKRLKPKPIKGLKRREWRAIEKGLAFVREERLQDADQFYRQFRGATTFTKTAAAVIVTLALSASYFAYESFQEQPPPFPWEELSLTQQISFRDMIDEGQFYLDQAMASEAFDHIAQAYEIHPRNPEATRRLRAVADLLLEQADTAETEREKQRLLNLVKDVSEQEYLEKDEALRDLREQLAADVFDLE